MERSEGGWEGRWIGGKVERREGGWEGRWKGGEVDMREGNRREGG